MLICTAVFCLQASSSLLDAWFALWPLASGRFMPWQVLSYAFLHGGMGTCSSTCWACGCSAPSSNGSGARSATCSSCSPACWPRRRRSC
jgi:hypothetical protein